LVQDAIIFADQVAAYGVGTPEFAVLQTLGYNLAAQVAVPESSSLALLGTSLLGLAALRRRRT
jgi:hypothetical protein